MQEQASRALSLFVSKLKSLSIFDQAGLVLLCALTPRSEHIQEMFANQLPQFRRLHQWLVGYGMPLLMITNILVVAGLLVGPFTGFMGVTIISLIAVIVIATIFLVPSILSAIGLVVTTYRQPDVYRAISSATRHRLLYIGRLKRSSRILSGLPGNVHRGLDGIRLLGCMNDLIDLADIDPLTIEASRRTHSNRALLQENQVRTDAPHHFSKAYGAIAEAMWEEDRLVSSARALFCPGRSNALFRSDSGSLLYEWLINRHSPLIWLLCSAYIAFLLSATVGLALIAATSVIVTLRIGIGAHRSRTISPESDGARYKLLAESLIPLIRYMKSQKHAGKMTKDLDLNLRKVAGGIQARRPIERSELLDLAAALEAAVKTPDNVRWTREILFFPYWVDEAIGDIEEGGDQVYLDIGPEPEVTISDQAFEASEQLTTALKNTLGPDAKSDPQKESDSPGVEKPEQPRDESPEIEESASTKQEDEPAPDAVPASESIEGLSVGTGEDEENGGDSSAEDASHETSNDVGEDEDDEDEDEPYFEEDFDEEAPEFEIEEEPQFSDDDLDDIVGEKVER